MNMFFCKCLFRNIFRKINVAVSGTVSLGQKSADSHYENQEAGNKEKNQTYTAIF